MTYCIGGMRVTGDALQRARLIFLSFPRKYITRVVVLFTDGETNMGPNVITDADLLKNQDASIFTIGIGSGISHADLNAVSSKPITTYKKLIAKDCTG